MAKKYLKIIKSLKYHKVYNEKEYLKLAKLILKPKKRRLLTVFFSYR